MHELVLGVELDLNTNSIIIDKDDTLDHTNTAISLPTLLYEVLPTNVFDDLSYALVTEELQTAKTDKCDT